MEILMMITAEKRRSPFLIFNQIMTLSHTSSLIKIVTLKTLLRRSQSHSSIFTQEVNQFILKLGICPSQS
ncbi:hypothetical protein FGO68_gene3916 [Halteria grandinella]|uniref:Uncharacterized protein n=1 Tax=Halteria grandinella TaxID=5974 RepID=A0A8J8P7C7_HALGN|nr:hypothetical protein FGO68_gene3916 [Halteria grandinella]